MQTELIIVALASALAAPAIAASPDAPYALRAVHADFEAQLGDAAAAPGPVGDAGRRAADLLAAQNAAQERLVLPLLGRAGAAAAGQAAAADRPDRMRLEAALSRLHEGDVDLVTTLVELYAAAEDAGQPEVARLAQRMIWHETSDIEVLYPAAMLVGATPTPARPFGFPAAGPLSGSGPFPMMGVGNPHPPATGN